MTDRLPVCKMNPVCDGKWAGIDVGDLLRERSRSIAPGYRFMDDRLASKYGIDVASIRRLAGECE